MKLRLLIFFGLLTSLFVGAQAQTESYDVVFVNADGKVLANNTTLVLNKVEEDFFLPGVKNIPGQLFVRNTSGKEQTVTLSCTLSDTSDGAVQVCALGKCNDYEENGTYEVGSQTVSPTSKDEEITIHRYFESNEKCTLKLQLTTKAVGADGATVVKAGPVVTLKFETDATGIASASFQNGGTYDVFNAQGKLLHRQISSLSKLSKGLYLVRQKDAKGVVSTRKYVVR